MEMKDQDGNKLKVGDWVELRDNLGPAQVVDSGGDQKYIHVSCWRFPKSVSFVSSSLTKISEDEALLLMLETQ